MRRMSIAGVLVSVVIGSGCSGGGGSDSKASDPPAPPPPPNTAPAAFGACLQTLQEQPVAGVMLATDAETADEKLLYRIVQPPAKGSVQQPIAEGAEFIYTPETNAERGPDSFTFEVADEEGDTATATMQLVVAPRVMPLGDSITSGVTDTDLPAEAVRVGYRQPLYEGLGGAGYLVDFVGSLQHGWERNLDFDHEGHGGWRAGELAFGNRDDPDAGAVYAWLQQNPADIVLLHIGTNDRNYFNSQDIVQDVANVLDEIDRWEANTGRHVKVLLARIIDVIPKRSEIDEFNDAVEQMVAQRVGDPLNPAYPDDVAVVDQQSAFQDDQGNPDPAYYSVPANYPERLHPNKAGYQVMADVWLEAVKPLLPKCP